ncbi:MAG: hypothetical protein GX652_06095 [Burkholderiaceae bacterium]|nr:hypothetical protein [Burkholderiaceae bacterium]
MGWWTKTIVGAGLFLGGLAGAVYCIARLIQIGTCASGGPYEIARPCPAGTELYILGVSLAVISALAGCWVLATRGRRRPVEPGLPPEGGDVNANPMPFGARPPQGPPRQ